MFANVPAANRGNDMKKEKNINDSLIAVEPHISGCYLYHPKDTKDGGQIYIRDKFNLSSCCVYFYRDDYYTIYLSSLRVKHNKRRIGLGNKILIAAEIESRKLGATKMMLLAAKDSWMHGWYSRHGYVDQIDHETRKNMIWMIKQL